MTVDKETVLNYVLHFVAITLGVGALFIAWDEARPSVRVETISNVNVVTPSVCRYPYLFGDPSYYTVKLII